MNDSTKQNLIGWLLNTFRKSTRYPKSWLRNTWMVPNRKSNSLLRNQTWFCVGVYNRSRYATFYYRQHLHKTNSGSSEWNLISCYPRLNFNPIYNLVSLTLLNIFMGLALVHFQKYWPLNDINKSVCHSPQSPCICTWFLTFSSLKFQVWWTGFFS